MWESFTDKWVSLPLPNSEPHYCFKERIRRYFLHKVQMSLGLQKKHSGFWQGNLALPHTRDQPPTVIASDGPERLRVRVLGKDSIKKWSASANKSYRQHPTHNMWLLLSEICGEIGKTLAVLLDGHRNCSIFFYLSFLNWEKIYWFPMIFS